MLYECLCFNLFVVCQNEDLKHVAGIVTRKREEKKKNLLRMIAYVFVWWGKVCLFGGISGSKEGQEGCKASRLYREYFLHWECIKEESRKFLRSLEYFLVPSMMSLLSLPHWSCSRFGLWATQSTQRSGLEVPPSHRSGISMTSLFFKSHA